MKDVLLPAHSPGDAACPETSPSAADPDVHTKKFVVQHFDDFVNKKDLTAVDRNMAADFLDHNGPGGRNVGRAEHRAVMAAMHGLMPNLRVEIKDAVVEGNKVIVRNLWTGTNAKTGHHVKFCGFVLLRIAEGKIIERWATVTPSRELSAPLEASPARPVRPI